ncbi:uncharacterized protein LOC130590381 [Beta vulgaris subsp. vulgaris]|uniref:uncharacterized protein LOC130589421 n=3 Tax=Beta vulgaris subsp. vulgaris TaxID=3555 RepID=UPI002547078D|nr:uncharacterized protein LOC130589421 [Beta vulgaris subsp. vulgaris]XP_057246885.1 uncharacterized protein LOC130589588 [Beta vulgaris subsp. vulgaris]XP_057248620.1 uncharacterized protein LOC130590381 [Beta vulgaris subsp. vulgaris]
MLAAMEPSLQKRFASLDAYSIIRQLKTMFQQQARIERYETHKAILECSLVEGKPVATHVFEMIGYFEAMERLGFPYSQELATDIILHSLHKGFNTFRLNFNMNGVSKTLAELHGMLMTAEQNITIAPKKEVLMVQKEKGFKKEWAGKKKQDKGKQVATKTAIKPQAKAKPKVAANAKCFYCDQIGHWKRNCPKYLKDKKSGASSSGTKKE